MTKVSFYDMMRVMLQMSLKVAITAVLIVVAAEASKRSALLGAILISLPLSSVLALSFLWVETGDSQKVIDLARGILLLVLPSLAFFVVLIALLKMGQRYWLALALSSAAMAVVFAGYSRLMQWLGWME